MQNDESIVNNEATNEIKTVEINQEDQTAAMTGPSVNENTQVSSSQSFGLDVSCSDDDEVSEVMNTVVHAELMGCQSTVLFLWTPLCVMQPCDPEFSTRRVLYNASGT